MKVQKQPNNWTCLSTSFAMILDLSVQDLFKYIGHDGSRKVWNLDDDRYNRQGHHIQEIYDICHQLKYCVYPIDVCPGFQHFYPDVKETPRLWSDKLCEERISVYLRNHDGVLVGTVNGGIGHAVAYHGSLVYDPRSNAPKSLALGDFHEFTLSTFYIVHKLEG